MMTNEELQRMAQAAMGGQQQYRTGVQVTVRQVDAFIDRVCKEKNHVLYSLAQALQWNLEHAPLISYPQIEVYGYAIQRIQQRMSQGES